MSPPAQSSPERREDHSGTPAPIPGKFNDRIRIDAAIAVGSSSLKVPGGNIEALQLELRPWGFEGQLTFWVHLEYGEDGFFEPMLTHELAWLDVTMAAWIPETSSTPEPLKVRGVITSKRIAEQVLQTSAEGAVITRRYALSFCDAPKALWTQHFPSLVREEVSLADVFTEQHVEGVQIDATHPEATRVRPHICLNLGGGAASLYDFIAHFSEQHAASLTWDWKENKLILADTKPALAGQNPLFAEYIAELRVKVPPVPRMSSRVLNTFADDPRTEPVEHAHAVTGLWRDWVTRTPVSAHIDAHLDREAARLKPPAPEVEIAFSRFPVVPAIPGTALKLATGVLSSGRFGMGDTLRVRELSLDVSASRDMVHDDWNTEDRAYAGRMRVVCEDSSDEAPRYPLHAAPRYPLIVEGIMLCDEGEDGDRTWANEENAESGLPEYRIRLPVFDDAVVRAPFEPLFLPGHFFAPTYRDSRVLLALELDTARIERHLDWGPNVQLPQDGQGNHWLLGKNADSHTSVKHEYVDNKPVFSIFRNSSGDTELLRLEEGIIVLQTKEE